MYKVECINVECIKFNVEILIVIIDHSCTCCSPFYIQLLR